MEPRVHKAFDDSVLDHVASLYGIGVSDCRLITDSESFVYACKQGERSTVLRITPGTTRDVNAVAGELEWISFLAQHGVDVANPILSRSEKSIEVVEGGGIQFLAVLFERAPGRSVTTEDWTPEFFEEWGRVLGRMHRIQAAFVPSRPEYDRPRWDEEYTVVAAPQVLADDPEILEVHRALVDEVRALPLDPGSFGIIHSDFEDENFFLDGKKITAFDFEESQYHWFAYDIACVLREGNWRLPFSKADREKRLRAFGEHFLRGYRSEKPIDAFWLRQIPLFARLREVCCYVYFLGKREWSELSPGDKRGVLLMREQIKHRYSPYNIDLSR